MAMSHKAYAFDWERFEAELRPLLEEALARDDASGLEAFVERYRESLTDPYEGEPLPGDWRESLRNRDVHEYGDYALTRYYDPADDRGVAEAWLEFSGELPGRAAALLGAPIGPPGRPFDPGRCGSYIQPPAQVRESLALLRPVATPAMAPFVALLERCAAEGRGVYVTF